MKKLLLLSLLFYTPILLKWSGDEVFAQQNKIDSLLILIKTDNADTNKLFYLNKLSGEYNDIGSYDSALFYANSALQLSNILLSASKDQISKKTIQKNQATSYNNIGIAYDDQGNYAEAFKNYSSSLKIYQAIGYKKGIAASYTNIGILFYEQGNYPEALKYYFISLKIREEIGDKKGVADSYNNIGALYHVQHNYSEALKNHFAALKIREAINDKEGISNSYGNIGITYEEQGNFPEALKNQLASLKITKEIGDKKGEAESYNNIGIIYFDKALHEKNPTLYTSELNLALKNQFACLKIYLEIGNKAGAANTYNNIGAIYLRQKKYKEAEENIIKSKEMSKEIGYKEYVKRAYSSLTELDSSKGDFKGAYENHKLYILYSDSLDNEETRKKTIQSQMTYDFEKKEAATKAEQDKKNAVSAADKKRQQLFLLFLVALAVTISIIAVVIFRGLQKSKRAKKVIEIQRDEISQQKEIVEHQKVLVEEHQKEIIDSITYAKRIQYTLLANKQLLENNLPEHFVLYKPKDIVSGDFYWATKKSWQSTVNREEKIKRFYIAACDSTGHGVPGAFMSLLNISFLNEAVNEKNILEPNEILNHVRKRLIENMDGGQDGMDTVLLCIESSDFDKGSDSSLKKWRGGIKITYSAANNSPVIIRNGKLLSLVADKMPVGKGENLSSFTLHTIEFEKGDSLYLYTDGYADQFGGPKGKKFKYKQLDELLITISHLPLNEQSEILNQNFENWKGNLEQVDDVTIIGIRV